VTTSFQEKIVDLDALLAVVTVARQRGQTVVQCHGCFDIVHPGHIRYLEFARRQGDVLIVSLTGDSDVDKGESRPYIPQELRAENLAALMFVDYVFINPAATAAELLSRVTPDVYVKGREYEHSTDPGFLAEKGVVERYGGRIIFSSGEVVFSSSALIEQMPRGRDSESHRLRMVCRRHNLSLDELDRVIDRFRDLHVVVVGDVVLDRYVLCDAIGVARESPMLSLIQRDERSYVGGAAIVARHLAALGAHAFLLSTGPDEEASRPVTDVLRSEGVESHLIHCRPSFVEKTRFLAEDAKLFKVDKGDRLPLDSIAERRAALILEQQSKPADAVIFCDFGYGTITGSLLARVLPSLRHNVRIITADVSGGRASLLEFHNVDLLCPTEREARAALNDFDCGLSAVAWNVLNQTQARHIFITLEKRGLVVFDRRSQRRESPEWLARLNSEQLPAFADFGVDSLGCGDALLAASTLSLAAGAELIKAAYLGNAAAAMEATTPGNYPIEVARLREWLRGRRELMPSGDATTTETAIESAPVAAVKGAPAPGQTAIAKLIPV